MISSNLAWALLSKDCIGLVCLMLLSTFRFIFVTLRGTARRGGVFSGGWRGTARVGVLWRSLVTFAFETRSRRCPHHCAPPRLSVPTTSGPFQCSSRAALWQTGRSLSASALRVESS